MDEGLSSFPRISRIGLALGPILALITFAALTNSGLSQPARSTAAAAVLMGVWWVTEALPIEAVSLVPLALFPLLGICTIEQAARPYANEIIFLFLGGLLLGLSMERSGLHKRIALAVLSRVGARPGMLLAGFLAVTAFISMWMSNTATTVMMLPIAMSVAAIVTRNGDTAHRGFATALVLGVAYAATIGGMATIIGSPPNAVAVAFAREKLGHDFTFLDWLRVGLPLTLAFLPIAWLILSRVFGISHQPAPGVQDEIAREKTALGPMSRSEAVTLAVFMLAAIFWVIREPFCHAVGLVEAVEGGRGKPLLKDSGIAIIAALLLFIIPSGRGGHDGRTGRVMDWKTATKLPYGVLLLFGGGLSLAEAMTLTKLDVELGSLFGRLGGAPPLLVIFLMVTLLVALTELASNLAVTTALMPVAVAAAGGLGLNPIALILPLVFGASCGFALPMGTAPNALVFASGRVTMGQMIRAGILLDAAGIVLITLFSYYVSPGLLGHELRASPP